MTTKTKSKIDAALAVYSEQKAALEAHLSDIATVRANIAELEKKIRDMEIENAIKPSALDSVERAFDLADRQAVNRHRLTILHETVETMTARLWELQRKTTGLSMLVGSAKSDCWTALYMTLSSAIDSGLLLKLRQVEYMTGLLDQQIDEYWRPVVNFDADVIERLAADYGLPV